MNAQGLGLSAGAYHLLTLLSWESRVRSGSRDATCFGRGRHGDHARPRARAGLISRPKGARPRTGLEDSVAQGTCNLGKKRRSAWTPPSARLDRRGGPQERDFLL